MPMKFSIDQTTYENLEDARKKPSEMFSERGSDQTAFCQPPDLVASTNIVKHLCSSARRMSGAHPEPSFPSQFWNSSMLAFARDNHGLGSRIMPVKMAVPGTGLGAKPLKQKRVGYPPNSSRKRARVEIVAVSSGLDQVRSIDPGFAGMSTAYNIGIDDPLGQFDHKIRS
jgi:hypothetical protein